MAKSFLYTRTGDAGTTALRGGSRVAKTCRQVEAYGSVDELNSLIGLVEAHVAALGSACPATYLKLLRDISARMFDVGACLSSSFVEGPVGSPIGDDDIAEIEEAIDALDASTPPQKTFILPGGSIAASHAQVARAVCRRAERRILAFAESGAAVPSEILVYVNRLSDFLFIFARYLNALQGVADIPWTPRQK